MGLGVNQILRQIYEDGTKVVLILIVIHLSDKQFICKTALDYKYMVLDVLVHSITEYCYKLCCILTCPTGM